MTGQHLITTTPSTATCRKCNWLVLSATVNGLDRQIDPQPLTEEGELAYLLAGLATFEIRGELVIRRSPSVIRGGSGGPVLVEHCCHPVPDHYIDHTHMQVATDLVMRLLGATPVDTAGFIPPF